MIDSRARNLTTAFLGRLRGYVNSHGLGAFLVRATTGSGVVQFASMLATFGVGVQLARMLGVAGYGFYGMALAIITLAGIPGELGVSRVVTRETAAAMASNDPPRLFGVLKWADRTVWLISGLIGIIVVVTSILLAHFQPSGLATALLLGSPMIPLMALARIRGGALQGLQHIVLGQIPATLVRPAVLSALLLAAQFAGMPVGAPTAMGASSIAAAAILLISQMLLSRRLPHQRPKHVVQSPRRWLASSVPMALTDGMRILQSELSILLVGVIASPSDVGLLRIAMVCATAVAAPIPIVIQVAVPLIARLHAENDLVRLQKAITRLAQAQTLGTLILTLPLFVAAGPLIRIAFGAEYVPAANAVRIVGAAQLINAFFGPNTALLNMTHNERRVTRAMAIALAFNVAAVLVFGIIAGLNGAAVGVLAAFLLWNVLTWADGKRILGVDTSAVPLRHARPRAR